MSSARWLLRAVIVLLPLLSLSTGAVFGADEDDYTPEVTARVVRISFIRGDAQIRRGPDQEWERATLNLPLVEGDEIATGTDARIEIQLDSYNHLRLAENSYLKFTTLRDEGVAVSLPQGTISLRVRDFDKKRSFFEIDAPRTTIAVEKTGMYRVDAGDEASEVIRVTAADGGEARVYSEYSGFTLRSGRSARINVAGQYAGEYDTTSAALFTDEFDGWVRTRDDVIARRLNDAYYDKYYDRDIYGAEDLNEHGQWIYTRQYGYVWRPYSSSVRQYANWSPYRYGHWRWVPVYGWTWVNDEPWGWATYHHGRWVWHSGYWAWTPYGQHRWRRSWWRPALVVVTWNGPLICWYPLPYDSGYYDYNRHYYSRYVDRRRYNTTIINNNTTVVVNPTPTPAPPVVQNPTIEERTNRMLTPTLQRIPAHGVVAVKSDEFGRVRKGYQTAPIETARTVLSRKPDENPTPPILPEYKDVRGKVSREILIENPRQVKDEQLRTGVVVRKSGAPLDEVLRREVIFRNRTPVRPTVREDRSGTETKTDSTEPRRTGAVNRPAPKTDDGETQTPNRTPRRNFPVPSTGSGDTGTKEEPRNDRREDRPIYRPKRDENPTPPIYAPPPQTKQEERRPPPSSYPRKEENPRREPSKPRDEPRQQQPPRQETRPQPPPRQENRPQPRPKQEPRNEPKENPPPVYRPPSVVNRKTEKDG